jgi:1,4-alpha-glucan branching enzyme
VGAPAPGFWREIANSDAFEYGGSGVGNMGGLETEDVPAHGRPWSLNLTMPPLAAVFLKWEPRDRGGESPPRPGPLPEGEGEE